SIHRPEVCLPGQGWTIRGGNIRELTLAGGGKLDVMNLALSREVEVAPDTFRVVKSNYYYFFVGKGVVTPHHWRRVFLTSWDRVLYGLNHRWAYVIVSSNVTEGLRRNGLNDEQTLEMLDEFTVQVAPYILADVLESAR
ncbi:MAG: exosortase-associated EpsI family protein, partial [Candidatus Methylacidiphilales bacterium]